MNNPLIDSMSEKEMNAQFERECKRFDWLYYHTHISKHSTPGFHDYCATNGTHTLFAEFKTAKGKLTLFQYNWLVNLLATGHRAYVVRPAYFGTLLEMLLRGSCQEPKVAVFTRELEYKLEIATQCELANCKWRGK